MVDFLILNTDSLPFRTKREFEEKFKEFRKILSILDTKRYCSQIRSSIPVKGLLVYEDLIFEAAIPKLDKDLGRLVKSFLANRLLPFNNPIVSDEEEKDYNDVEYFYGGTSNRDMGYVHLFDTFLISFASSKEWEKEGINLIRNKICENELVETEVQINNISLEKHIEFHKGKFTGLRNQNIEELTNNFVEFKKKYFSNKIIILEEVDKSIGKLDKSIRKAALTILYDLETENRVIDDYNYSDESDSVKQDPNLKKERCFTIDGKKEYVFFHLKNLPSSNRIYFKEENGKIYICYIGKHLPTKKF